MSPLLLLRRVLLLNASVFVFLLVLLFDLSAPSSAAANLAKDSSSADRQALLVFKSELLLHGTAPSAVLVSWVSTTTTTTNGGNSSSPPDFCAWRGVACSRGRHPFRVIGLDLHSQGLAGGIPPVVANLTFLGSLDLSDNRLHGRIPPELGRLARLRELNLSVNSLDGEIPNELSSSCSRLEAIVMWNNSLAGEIPSGLGRCSRLRLIHFSSNKLQGSIPRELGALPALRQLILSGNNLVGAIPDTLGSSSSIVYVNLGQNYLTGVIPSSLASSPNLQSLELPYNSLSGEIPASLFNSSSLLVIDLGRNNHTGSIPDAVAGRPSPPRPLQFLTLSENGLSGRIPASLGNFSSLSAIYLNQNNLVGSIPDGLGALSLEALDVSVNKLSGQVPVSLYNSSVLSFLNLGNNSLTGMIPSDIGIMLPSVSDLIFAANRFEGVIPASLANASGLQVLDLSVNSFHGAIPSLGSLTNLIEFDVGLNKFEQPKDWGFISSLSNCSQLSKLLIDGNDFEGSLPKSIGNLSTSLTWLWVGNNRFSGNLPAEIGNLKNLTVFYADHNQFTGSIPQTLGDLRNMDSLSFSNNRLTGRIPDSIGNLQKLVELYLQMNQLEGIVPSSIQGCTSLLMLNLSSNNLDGSIPAELFTLSSLSRGLDLSHNQFSGSIHPQIGNLINLGLLNLSGNNLTGKLPSSLGQCVLLQFLKLDGNFLEGSIPESFTNLKGIQAMDLSRNNFSGEIPSFFQSFRLLHYLNLSFNDFSGAIPAGGPFDNTSEAFLQGNKGLCTLTKMSGFQLCSSAPNSRKQNTSHVLKIVLPVAVLSFISLTSCLLAAVFIKKARKTQTSSEIGNKQMEKVSYADIVKATDEFSSSNLVGSGRFGKVYKGTFHFSVDPVAIKVFNLQQHGASKSFLQECEALRNIRHRNLVRVITICSSFDHTGKEFKALLFQYMSNGTLEKWIQSALFDGDGGEMSLSLGQRINIAVDVALALDYLHNQCVPPLVHCDLKPSNILLDRHMTAYVADFGLAKFLGTENYLSESGSNSTALHGPNGSVGYIAPEYGVVNRTTTEGDVYSYGVILLQMLTGKRPTDEIFKEGFTLHHFVKEAFPARITEILDPILLQLQGMEATSYALVDPGHQAKLWMQNCIIPLVKVALLCSVETPKRRLKMQDVCYSVSEIREEYLRSLHYGDVQRPR